MSKMKKLIAGVSALVIGATCATVASAEFKFAGYDTSVITQETFGNYRIGVVYQDVDPVTGYATGAVVSGETATLYGLEPTVAASFSAPLFELDYPNNEYVAVYAQNPETNAVEFTGKYLYNGENLNLQYRDVNYMWELAAPHRIYKRTQALINGAWFRNNTYPTRIYAGDVATVKAEYVNYYGFGDWMVIDANEDGAAEGMAYYTPAINANPALVPYMNTNDNIVAYDRNGVAKTFVNALDPFNGYNAVNLTGYNEVDVEKTFSLVVAGPTFNENGGINPGDEFSTVVDAANVTDAATLANFAVNHLVKNVYSHDGSCALVETKWVDAGFERAAPHYFFQYLEVDGIVLNGAEVNGTRLPLVFRYIVDTNGHLATAYLTTEKEYVNFRPVWNASVAKFELIADEKATFFYNGIEMWTETVATNVHTGVFGNLNYTDNGFVNGVKKITARFEARNGVVLEYVGPTMETINWGAPVFVSVDANLDAQVANYSAVVVNN